MGKSISVNRLGEVSILRPIFLLTIVFYHCLCFYCTVWSTSCFILPYDFVARIIVIIALAGFTLISGYVFEHSNKKNKYKSFIQLIWEKSKRLILPYLFFGAIIQFIFPQYKLFVNPLHLWYLPMLFLCFLVGYWVRPYTQFLKNKWIILLLLAVFVFIFQRILTMHFSVLFFSAYFPFFLAGMFLYNVKFEDSEFTIIKSIGFLSFVFIFILTTLIECKIQFIPLGLIERLRSVCSLGIILYLLVVSKKTIILNVFFDNMLNVLNKYSMGIYIFHHIYLTILLSYDLIGIFMSTHFLIAPIILFIVIFLLSVISSVLFSKVKYVKNLI